jgi:hypothetical protein
LPLPSVIVPVAFVCGLATAADAEEYHPDSEQAAQVRVARVTKTTSDSMVGICWRSGKVDGREDVSVG